MKTIYRVLSVLLGVAALACAQTSTTFTTLAAAMAAGDKTISLSSSTSVTAATLAPATGLFIDREYLTIVSNVNSANTGNVWNVKRGVSGLQAAHASGATVIVGPPSNGPFERSQTDHTGTCTATLFAYLPIVNVLTGNVSRCAGGMWVVGGPLTNPAQPYSAFTTLSPGLEVASNSTSHVDGTIWFSQIFIPKTVVLTGACQLNGATVTTDNTIVALYDAGGVLMANSAVAGVADASNASIYQCQAFTSKVIVPGPATYYAAIQTKGTTDNFQAYAAGSAPTNYGTQSQTGTFGTLAAMTTPTTTFTANKGPLMMVY